MRQPGIYTSVSFEEYRAWDAANYSTLKIAHRSMAHLREAQTAPPEPSEVKLFGTALHLAILEPERFGKEVAPKPKFDRRTTAGKDGAAQWEADHPGCIGLDPDEWGALNRMRDNAMRHAAAQALLERAGPSEASALWGDPSSGVLCKARFDRISYGATIIIDLKSARDGSPEGFARASAQFGYDMQAAHYTGGASALTGAEFEFRFLVIEKEPPYAVAVYKPSQEMLEVGRNRVDVALRRWKEAKQNNNWPGYGEAVMTLSMPGWAEAGWIE